MHNEIAVIAIYSNARNFVQMNHGDLGPVQRWASERQFQNPKHIHAHDTVTPLLLKLAIFEFHDLHATQGKSYDLIFLS